MVIKLLFIILLIFIMKMFIERFNFKDYFNIIMSFLFLFFSYIYIMTNRLILVIFILIIAISLILYSLLKLDYSDNSIIVIDGNINFKNMYKSKYTISRLFKDIKKNKISYLDSDSLLVLKDNNLVFYSKNIRLDRPIPIIISGIICSKELSLIGKSINWLEKRLVENNIKLENIFYSFYYNNKLYIIRNK